MKNWKLKNRHKMEQQKPNNRNTIVTMGLITVIVFGLFGIFMLLNKGNSDSGSSDKAKLEESVENVSMKDGKQVIEILAKGGYSPRRSIAKANVPTVIKFKTRGTYDCSSSVRIPSLNISKNLPGTGETEIEIGSQPVGKLSVTCGMGMYFFEVDFQS